MKPLVEKKHIPTLALLALFLFVCFEREHIADFFSGIQQGYSDRRDAHY